MSLCDYVNQLVMWTSSLKQTVQQNQFEKNRISSFVWGSGLQGNNAVNNVQFLAQTGCFAS